MCVPFFFLQHIPQENARQRVGFHSSRPQPFVTVIEADLQEKPNT